MEDTAQEPMLKGLSSNGEIKYINEIIPCFFKKRPNKIFIKNEIGLINI